MFSLYARLQVCVNYLVNQKYYAEVLCENKAVKNSCCKGKCVLGKELANIGAKENNSPSKDQGQSFKTSKGEEAITRQFDFQCLRKATIGLPVLLTYPIVEGNVAGVFRPPTA